MFLVSYRIRGSQAAWKAGIAHAGSVVDLTCLPSRQTGERAMGNALSVRQLLEQGPAALAGVFAEAEACLAAGTHLVPLDQVELGPPVPDPDKILCLGLNYRDHAAEAGQALPSVPMFFAKFRNCLIGPENAIELPRVSTQVDYEGELAVVIGRRCKDVPEREALQCVAGYTIMNDVSARDLQMQTSQWTAGKALDTFAPLGPGIVPATSVANPQALTLTTRLNGAVVQHASTADMIFPVARIIAFLSSLMTLMPGDIIATGTPAGVGFKRNPPLFLQDGDYVEIEIEDLGRLGNPVRDALR